MDTVPLSFIFLQISPEPIMDWGVLLINILLFVVLLLGSAFASSSEVAFFSLTKAESEEFKTENTPYAKKVWEMLNKHKHLIATILITNNFVNIFSILVGTYIISSIAEYFHLSHIVEVVLDIATLSILLLLFGEIIPKVYAARYRLTIVKAFYAPLYTLMWLYSPIINFLIFMTKFIDKRFQPRQENASIHDIKEAIDLMPEPNSDASDGRDILRGVLNLRDTTVENVIKERTQVVAIEYDMLFSDLIPFIQEHEFSRLPVYEDRLDNIKGILHIKDLLPLIQSEDTNPSWQTLIRPALFVPESKKIDNLLEEFRQKRTQIAIVVDEFGGTTGIVTLEDITDEIFGEIRDEYDEEEKWFEQVEDDAYRFKATTRLNDFIRVMDFDEEIFDKIKADENINSLSGLILFLNGKIPTQGETVVCNETNPKLTFFIHSVGQNKIDIVVVKVEKI